MIFLKLQKKGGQKLEHITKLILFIASIFITIGIISFALIAYHQSLRTSSISNNQLNDFSKQLSISDLVMYDGKEIQGNDVVNLIKKKLGEFTDTEIAPIYINVVTSKSINKYINGVNVNNIQNFTSVNYINPNAIFLGEIQKDKNHVILGIKFTQK